MLTFWQQFKNKHGSKAKEVYNDIKAATKESVEKNSSALAASSVSIISSALGFDPLFQFLVSSEYALITDFLLKLRDKPNDNQRLIVEQLKNEEFRKELSKIVCEIISDEEYLSKDWSWIKNLLQDIDRQIKDSIEMIKAVETRIFQIFYFESGFRPLLEADLTEEIAKQEIKRWQQGFPLGFAAIYHNYDFRRNIVDVIKQKLEENRKVAIVGESGMSKSTIWMRILCEYVRENYRVIYNEGDKIDYPKAAQYIRSLGRKVLVAVDNANSENTSAIFRLMYELDLDAKFIVTIRKPDFNRFLELEASRLDEPTRRSMYKFESELKGIEVSITNFNKDEIMQFFERYGRRLPDRFREEILEYTRGHPLMVRFYLTGSGLLEHVRDRHDRFISIDEGKMQTMMVCALSDLAFEPITNDILHKLHIEKDAYWLEQASVYFDGEKWKIIHHLWGYAWLYHLFNEKDRFVLQKRITILRNALLTILNISFDRFANAVYALFVIASIKTRFDEISRYVIDLDLLLNDLAIDKVFSNLGDNELSLFLVKIEAPALIRRERHLQAIKNCDKAIELDQNNFAAWNNRGWAFTALQRYNDAIECFDKAITLQPDFGEAWYNKGLAHDELHEQDKAIKAFDHVLALNPEFERGWFAKGQVHHDLGEFDHALICFEKCTALKSDDEYYWSAKGHILHNLRRFKEAHDCFSNAILLNPNYAEAWMNKGSALAELGNEDEAINCYDKAITLQPDFGEAWHYRAKALARKKLFDLAIESYNRAISINPKDIESWHQKGWSHLKLTQYDESMRCFAKCLVSDIPLKDRGFLLRQGILELTRKVLGFEDPSLIDNDILLVQMASRISNNFKEEILSILEYKP